MSERADHNKRCCVTGAMCYFTGFLTAATACVPLRSKEGERSTSSSWCLLFSQHIHFTLVQSRGVTHH